MKTKFKKPIIEHSVERHDLNHIFTWFETKNDEHPNRLCAMHIGAKPKDYIIVLEDEGMTDDENHDWAAWKLLSDLELQDRYTLLRATRNPSDFAFNGGWIYLLMRKIVSS
ncbi:hypothetical protein [Limnobacter sp.]|uniref:hypothetical protein n=1 Tax=Limnobacter sp. TaxID=2003368 RepID=UPI0025BA6A03|nr:hypothetical protein [Limnobacter sp.]